MDRGTLGTTPNYSDFITDTTQWENVTRKPLPIDMQFNDGHRLSIGGYTLLMIVSAIANTYVFVSIVR